MAQENFNDNLVSSRQEIIKKYDVNGDGVFDTNEINCIMDDFMFMTQTNKSLTDTIYNQKKLLIGTFLLVVLLSISNLGTALLAVNMSKELVVVDGKIMANGGSEEEAISTMTSVRTVFKQFNGTPGKQPVVEDETRRKRHLELLQSGNDGKILCFGREEVQSFFANAMNGSGTNLVLEETAEDGSTTSTRVININGSASVAEDIYSFSNFQFVPVDIESCEGETRRSLQGDLEGDLLARWWAFYKARNLV
jgi:hypothetical protein